MLVLSGITAMKGPSRVSGVPQPGIANGTELLVTATGDIVLQNDILTQDFNSGTSVLGIFSSGGDVRVGSSAPDEMYLDAFVMATGSNGVFTVDGYSGGSPRGLFHLRGGMVTSYYGAFGTFGTGGSPQSGYQRDFRYDGRGLIPPYFPGNSIYTTNLPTARALEWREL